MNGERRTVNGERHAAAQRIATAFVFIIPWLLLVWHLSTFWLLDPQYSYGWVTPAIAVFFGWRQRQSFRPTNGGNPLVLAGAIGCILLIGLIWFVHDAVPDWSVINWLFGIVVAGYLLLLVAYFWGGEAPKHFAFPILFILLAIPWPQRMELVLVQALMKFVSATAAQALAWLNIPAMATGNIIQIASGTVGIDEACSGVRSLQAMLMVSIFLGELRQFKPLQRIILVFLGSFFALFFNLVRTTLLTWVAATAGFQEFNRWHDPAGLTILCASFFCLWAASHIFRSEASIELAPATMEAAPVNRRSLWVWSLRFCRDWVWGLILLVSVALVYSPVWKAGFVWDDEGILTANPCIVGPFGLTEIWTTHAADICPFTLTTFWLEHAIWGLNSLSFHLVNVLLHGACALVLWQVLRSLRVQGAWMGAALWALHPVMVESVAWVTEMKNTESGLFFLLSILFFVRSLKAKDPVQRSEGGWPYGLALLFAALAMASKSSTVVLPLILCLCAWWLEGRWHWRNLSRTVPMFLMAIAAGAVSIWTQSLLFAEGIEPHLTRTWPQRLVEAGDAIWFYLGKLLWPHPLVTIYPPWHMAGGPWVSDLAVLAMLIVFSIFWLKGRPWARACLFAFACFLAALLPVMGLIDNTIFRFSLVFDHLQYLASIGPLALAGAALGLLSHVIVPNERWFASGLCAGLLIVLGIVTWQRTWVYESNETLWTDTLARNPDCWVGHNNLGDALLQTGQLDGAFAHFQRAVEVYPEYAEAHDNLGVVLLRKGQVDEAVAEFQKALRIYPNHVAARSNLGGALLRKGKLDDSVVQLEKALKINPVFADAHNNLGVALFQKGQLDEALAQFQEAIRIKPNNAEAHYNLGNALVQKGELDEAIDHFQKSLEINPSYAEVRNNLGNLLVQKGELDQAVTQFQKALEVNPRFAEARNNLGNALFKKGQLDQALIHYQNAIQINPDFAEARNSFGIALIQKGKLEEAITQFQEALRSKPDFNPAQDNLTKVQALVQQREGHK